MARRRRAGERSLIDDVWKASFGGVVMVLVFSAFVNVLKFATPLYLLQVLDRIPASRSLETLVMLTIIVLVAVACGYALDIIRSRMMGRWSGWIEERLGPEVLRRGTGSSGRREEDGSSQAFFDLGTVSRFAGGTLLKWIDLIWAPVFVFGVYLIHPTLGSITLGACLVLVAMGVLQDRMTRLSRKAASAARRDNGEFMRTIERNHESVDALQLGDNLVEVWRRNETGRLIERDRTSSRNDTFRLLMGGLGQFLRIGILAAGVWLVILDQLTIGSIFAARLMAGFGFRLVEGALRNWRPTREALVAYDRLNRYFMPRNDSAVSLPSDFRDEPLLLGMMSHRYPYQRDYLFRRLDLQVAPREFVLVSGPAGSGKSTLTRIMVGVIPPKNGTARLGDFDLVRLPPETRAGFVGYMPQDTELFDATIRENISRLGESSFDDVVEAAKLLGIHDIIVGLPDGYDTRIGPDPDGMLSGSQRKRICLARAFFGKPGLIVLDEPAANLDAPSRRVLEAAVRQSRDAGARVVVTQAVSSQRMSKIADRLVTLGGPTIKIAEASPEQRPAKRSRNLRTVK